MEIHRKFVAGAALAALMAASPAASAQEGSMQVGNATVSVGGGTAVLTLPDVPSIMLLGQNGGTFRLLETFKASDDFGDEWGWNVNGSVSVPMGANRAVSLNGFWANIDDEDSATCTLSPGGGRCILAPLVDDPTVAQTNGLAGTGSMSSVAEREVDQWGASLEIRQMLNPGAMGATRAPPRRYLAVAADIRGIDQQLSEIITGADAIRTVSATYDEDLDTRYYGAYLAWGGDFPRLVLGGLWDALGLHSTFQLRGGVYHADTDYEGRLVATGGAPGTATSALTLSNDDVAFIGGLTMETSKRIGSRAKLSLRSEYEYYSSVPEMAYNQRDQVGASVISSNGQNGTVINDDDAFSMRTSLRLTIGLGPQDLYQ